MNKEKDNKKDNKRKKNSIGKPNPFLYYPLVYIAGLYFKIRLGVHIDKSSIKNLKGPALFLCPHISNLDFILVAMALAPLRPNFVASQHFMARPLIRWFLTKMAVIPKKMYCADIRAMMQILRGKEQGHQIVLFPEGRLTCFGHSVNLTDGTAELVKKLGIDVYTVTGNGAYLTLPKWGKCGLRPGKIKVETAHLLSPSEIGEMTVAEIQEALECAMLHDEDEVARGMMANVSYRAKSPAAGLDGIIYHCPHCKAEFKMESEKDILRCRACGTEVRLDEKYVLHGGAFSSINEWYLWQQDQIDLDKPLESQAIVMAADENGNRDKNAGQGTIKMDKDSITFTGTVFGEPLEFIESTGSVKAFPASVGSHFDIYHNKVMYNFRLQPDPRINIKWVAFLDKLNENIRRS